MADHSNIEWTDATWNPITGCSIVSPGCAHCYAMGLAGTRLRHHTSRVGLTDESKSGPVWNGKVHFNGGWLLQPISWKKPRMIFVCAHGDLFHEAVPDEWIDRVFGVMALASQHTFQVLTKRPARMRSYFEAPRRAKIVFATSERDHGRQWYDRDTAAELPDAWPLPNVWLGVSAERQKEADERIPHLLATPAAVRWVSAEPLLGPIDVSAYAEMGGVNTVLGLSNPGIDWIVVGGESGDGSRAMHPQWARDLRDQCGTAGMPFFFKQWGNWAPSTEEQARGNPRSGWKALSGNPLPKRDELYPAAGAEFVERMTKGKAGRHLDGVLHDALPAVPR